MPRAALIVLQIGAIAVVVAASPWTVFDLDRFFVPKELVLHATALLAGLLTVRSMRKTRVDALLLAFLGLSALSALFATNRWLGLRALAVSASAVVLFWAARTVREAGFERQLINALATAVVVAAALSLAQAYGLRTDFFSLNRAPGGTLGNRNFVAHMAAFGLPLCMLAALRARRYALAGAGVLIVAAALVLTRSRAGWLAAGVALLLFTVLSLREHGLRLLGLLGFAVAGALLALVLPNALHWRSGNPYLDSMTGMVEYEKGSGHGRLLQYQRSLPLAARHLLLGAGPGNWPVEYPRHAPRNDPSLNDSEPGMTFNPWPSSDWIAFLAERGFITTIFLGLALLAMIRRDAALLATLGAAVVAGLFDAVLLLSAPALIVWTALGALSGAGDVKVTLPPLRVAWLAVVISAAGVYRSTAQLTAMQIFVTHSDRASLERAARIDPGNYRLQMRLARGGRTRCVHALAAHELYPSAQAASDASRGCR